MLNLRSHILVSIFDSQNSYLCNLIWPKNCVLAAESGTHNVRVFVCLIRMSNWCLKDANLLNWWQINILDVYVIHFPAKKEKIHWGRLFKYSLHFGGLHPWIMNFPHCQVRCKMCCCGIKTLDSFLAKHNPIMVQSWKHKRLAALGSDVLRLFM